MKAGTLSEQRMHEAVRNRDPRFDGRFVYGVVTTGIFCRPRCPSRPARPENLRFFLSLQEAMDAGYRPCKRCAPQDPQRDIERIAQVARYIETNVEDKLTLRSIAKRFDLSAHYLQKVFKAAFGVSPKAYHNGLRLGRLKKRLRAGSDITSAIFESGYGSTSRFYEHSERNIGMKASAYRAGGHGERIVYASRRTSLGVLMMAATERGVCFAMFDQSKVRLKQALEAEFPRATLSRIDDSAETLLDPWIDSLEAYLCAQGPAPDLPLDLRGSAFQIAVWTFLRSIPEGETVSYSDVAAGVGRPRAVRAAASACAGNRIAVLVPCHRVLCKTRELGAYRWGTDRKRKLLQRESAADGP